MEHEFKLLTSQQAFTIRSVRSFFIDRRLFYTVLQIRFKEQDLLVIVPKENSVKKSDFRQTADCGSLHP